jgi:hypothetical protein
MIHVYDNMRLISMWPLLRYFSCIMLNNSVVVPMRKLLVCYVTARNKDVLELGNRILLERYVISMYISYTKYCS